MKYQKEYDFLGGEKYLVKTIPFEKVQESVSNCPGIYGWYIRPKPNRENEIHKIADELLQQSKLHASLKGNIRLDYAGILTKKVKEQNIENLEMLRNIFVAFPYPLYIGMSLNLRQRLDTHIKQLYEQTRSTHTGLDVDSIRDLDTDDESKCFAQRISSLFVNTKIEALDCLYVRVYEYQGETLTTDNRANIRRELSQVESMANSIFNPVFGRR